MGSVEIEMPSFSEKTGLLSSEEKIPSVYQRSCRVLLAVLAVFSVILTVCLLIPAALMKSNQLRYPVHFLEHGASIYLKGSVRNSKDIQQYVRVNTTHEPGSGVKHSQLLLSEPFPRVHSSAFIVHRERECFRLESKLGTWVYLDEATGELRGDYSDEITATKFVAVMVGPKGRPNRQVGDISAQEDLLMKLKLCSADVWLTINEDGIAGYSKVNVFPHPSVKVSSRVSSGVGAGSISNSNSDSDSNSNSNSNAIENEIAVSAGAFEVELVKPIRGVNLGGWFIPEVWMTPSFFENDPYPLWKDSLCTLVNSSRAVAEERMAHRLEHWITEEDFRQIADMGFNSVRLPIGYWNIVEDPYQRYAPADYRVGRKYIDFTFDMADKYGLSVLLDLHGAPGENTYIAR
jgi:hypothetical protein